MKRFYISLIILSSILGICIYSVFSFSKTQQEIIPILDAIEDAALKEEDQQVVRKLCEEYESKWREREKYLFRTIRHPQLDEISTLTAELPYLASDDSYSHLLAAIEHIRVDLERVGDAEIFSG